MATLTSEPPNDEFLPPNHPWRQRISRLLRELVWTALLVGLVFMVVSSLGGRLQLPEMAPDFRAVNLDGQDIVLSHLRGKPVVLYFWASWCGACKLTSPTVKSFAENHPQVQVVAVSMEDPHAMRAEVGDIQHGMAFVSQNSQILEGYPVRALPTTVVIDAQGKVLWSRQGVLLPGELNCRVP